VELEKATEQVLKEILTLQAEREEGWCRVLKNWGGETGENGETIFLKLWTLMGGRHRRNRKNHLGQKRRDNKLNDVKEGEGKGGIKKTPDRGEKRGYEDLQKKNH